MFTVAVIVIAVALLPAALEVLALLLAAPFYLLALMAAEFERKWGPKSKEMTPKDFEARCREMQGPSFDEMLEHAHKGEYYDRELTQWRRTINSVDPSKVEYDEEGRIILC